MSGVETVAVGFWVAGRYSGPRLWEGGEAMVGVVVGGGGGGMRLNKWGEGGRIAQVQKIGTSSGRQMFPVVIYKYRMYKQTGIGGRSVVIVPYKAISSRLVTP